MRSAMILSGGLLVPSVIALATPWLEVCSVDAVLEYFTCHTVPEACFEDLATQATAWCSSYLSIEPVTEYLSTETPAAVETVTETSTITTTTIEGAVTTAETTTTTTSTQLVQETVTVTTTVTGGGQTVKKRVPTITSVVSTPAPSCVDLTKKNLLQHPSWKLSKACSCLNPQPTTVTLPVTTVKETATSTVTETAVATDIVTETSVSTEVSVTVVTEATTVTSTTTATATATLDLCDVRYTGGGNGQGNTVQAVGGVTSARDCCERCLAKANCVASASTGAGNCNHLVNSIARAGALVNAQCPLGVETYGGFTGESPTGIIFKGPCVA